MWRDKAQTWGLAHELGGQGLVDLIRDHSHTCYLGERGALHDWGYGCGNCPACELRAARIQAARQDIATLMQAVKLYKLDNQRYPTTEQGLQALMTKPTAGPAANGWKTGGYVDKLPKDPWGNPYLYLSPGVKGEVDIFSLGADGQPGGTGNDADIGSWES
jgi:type II secretion system protein G